MFYIAQGSREGVSLTCSPQRFRHHTPAPRYYPRSACSVSGPCNGSEDRDPPIYRESHTARAASHSELKTMSVFEYMSLLFRRAVTLPTASSSQLTYGVTLSWSVRTDRMITFYISACRNAQNRTEWQESIDSLTIARYLRRRSSSLT